MGLNPVRTTQVLYMCHTSLAFDQILALPGSHPCAVCPFSSLMLCPYCLEHLGSKHWKPSQWKLSKPILGEGFDGCRSCNVMPLPKQHSMIQCIEWRAWYIRQNGFQQQWAQLLKQVHDFDPGEKSRLHDLYHNDPGMPQVGMRISGRFLLVLAPKFCLSKHIGALDTASHLLEQSQAFAVEIQHQCAIPIKELMSMLHYLQLYLTVQIPAHVGPFWDDWRDGL